MGVAWGVLGGCLGDAWGMLWGILGALEHNAEGQTHGRTDRETTFALIRTQVLIFKIYFNRFCGSYFSITPAGSPPSSGVTATVKTQKMPFKVVHDLKKISSS